MNIMEFSAAFSCACALMSTSANALDTSLYAEAAPEDASFVRFVGFEQTETPAFGGKAFALHDVAQGVYVPVSAALLDGVPAGSYASVVKAADGQVQVIEEAPRSREARVSLFLVNASDAALDLRLADNAATVIDSVQAGTSGLRAVNPVQASLGVFADGSDVAIETFDVTLQRGQNLTFLATEDGVQLIKNSFGPVAK